MKKLICILLVLCCLTSLCSCGIKLPLTKKTIVYGEKYILSTEVSSSEEEQDYYLFDEEYLSYHVSTPFHAHYLVKYKYEFVDAETVVYFFDSVEIYDDDKTTEKYSMIRDQGILTLSKNVIVKTAVEDDPNDIYDMYVRESYGKEELKNFGHT